MSELNEMIHSNELNEIMLEEGENLTKRLRLLLKFFNKRVRYYNIEIHLLTHQVLKLKKDIFAYYDILEEYKKDVKKQVKVDVLECKLCRDELCNCVIEPCNHIVCCYGCFKKIEDGKCPICRTEYTECYKIYY